MRFTKQTHIKNIARESMVAMIRKIFGGILVIGGAFAALFALVHCITEYKSGDSTVAFLYILLVIAGLVFLWTGWRIFKTKIEIVPSEREQILPGTTLPTSGKSIRCAHLIIRKNKNILWPIGLILFLANTYLSFQKLVEEKMIANISGFEFFEFSVLLISVCALFVIIPAYWKIAGDILENENWQIKQVAVAVKTMFYPTIFFFVLIALSLLTLYVVFYTVWPTVFKLSREQALVPLIFIFGPIIILGFLYFSLRSIRPELSCWESVKLASKFAFTGHYWGVFGIAIGMGILNRIVDKASDKIWTLWGSSPVLFFLALILTSLVSAYLACWWYVSTMAYLKPRWESWLGQIKPTANVVKGF